MKPPSPDTCLAVASVGPADVLILCGLRIRAPRSPCLASFVLASQGLQAAFIHTPHFSQYCLNKMASNAVISKRNMPVSSVEGWGV